MGATIAVTLTGLTLISLFLERLAEYVVVGTIDKLYAIVAAWLHKPGVMPPQLRLVLVSAAIFTMYMVFFSRVDLVSGLFAELGVEFEQWQAAVLGGVLVAGGSNFVHDVAFGKLAS